MSNVNNINNPDSEQINKQIHPSQLQLRKVRPFVFVQADLKCMTKEIILILK